MIAWVLANWHYIIPVLLGLYELIVRIVPTASSWSILSAIISALKWLSSKLDNTTGTTSSS